MCGIDPASKWLFTRASHRIRKSWVSRVRVYTCTGGILWAHVCVCVRAVVHTCRDVGMAEDYFRVGAFVCSRMHEGVRRDI